MRMTPKQLETRCTHNVVYCLFDEQQRHNPLWRRPEALSLLGRGPKFIPKARPLLKSEVQEACARLGFRLVRAFQRYANQGAIGYMCEARREAGIQDWRPKQDSLSTADCRQYVQDFFKCNSERSVWRDNFDLSPAFDRHIRRLEVDILEASTRAKKLLTLRHSRSNITKAEQKFMEQMSRLDVGFNIADKNLAPVVYSKSLFKEQCLLHLEDAKGTYRQVYDRSTEDIMDDITRRLSHVLSPFKSKGEGWSHLVESLVKDSKKLAARGKVCKFYILWKLHKAASASGLRSRPITAAVGYVTGPASQRGSTGQS